MSLERYSPQEQVFYRAYLQSAAWRARKERRLVQAGRRCEFEIVRLSLGTTTPERCRRVRYLQVHHNTYERLGQELDQDLDVFCWVHHLLEHLLWKRCTYCQQPCLVDDERAELWLLATLATRGIDLDRGPVDWRKLPPKESFLAEIPHTCSDCRAAITQYE